jgi:uncharacterized membrane protein
MSFPTAFIVVCYVLQVLGWIKLFDAAPLIVYMRLINFKRLDCSKALGKMAMAACDYNIQALAVDAYFRLLCFGFHPVTMGFILAVAAGSAHFSQKCLEMAIRRSRTSSRPSPARPKSPAIDAFIKVIIIYMASKRRFTCGVTTTVGNTMQQLANLLLYFTIPTSAVVDFATASLR